MNDRIKQMLNTSIGLLDSIYKELEELNLLDNQESISWLDAINEISVRH